MLDKNINQLLLTNLRTKIIIPLNDIIEWDRYGIRTEDDSGFIFGWIKRKDSFYDFVVIRFWLDWSKGNAFFCSYDTSSKKYSKEIGYRLGSDMQGYVECKSVRDLPEAKLVSWQSNIKELLTITLIGLLFMNVLSVAITQGFNMLTSGTGKTKSGKRSILDDLRRISENASALVSGEQYGAQIHFSAVSNSYTA